MLNPNASDPLYMQLARRLIDQIQTEEFEPGHKMLSIRKLAEQYQVSNITAIRALDELRKNRYVFSIQGKGYFISQHKIIHKYMPTQDGFSAMAEKEGLTPSSLVLNQEIQQAGEHMGQEFGIEQDSEMVVLERVRLVDGFPLCIQTSYLPHDLCYGLLDFDFSQFSLYQILRGHYHITMAKSQYTIQAGLADGQVLMHLNLQAPAAILRVGHWAFTSSGRLFEYGITAYRADCFQINSPVNVYEITGDINASNNTSTPNTGGVTE
jgi:GntR family transcriptional regulator